MKTESEKTGKRESELVGQRFIVAEVSKTWVNGQETAPGLLSQRFEGVIELNYRRGYRLQSFSLHRLMTRPGELNETIIAVFESL